MNVYKLFVRFVDLSVIYKGDDFDEEPCLTHYYLLHMEASAGTVEVRAPALTFTVDNVFVGLSIL